MIDRSLNYGRHHIESFLKLSLHFVSALDIGAGLGDDILLIRKVNQQKVIHAIEVYPEYADRLTKQGVVVHVLNIERDKLPFADGSIDII